MSLILDIVEKIGIKRVFIVLEESFELTVVFFGLTNSPATFWTIINEILRDLLNTEKIASFINDVIVETEEKKEYNEVVEEVIRKLDKNNLYMKLEKYK